MLLDFSILFVYFAVWGRNRCENIEGLLLLFYISLSTIILLPLIISTRLTLYFPCALTSPKYLDIASSSTSVLIVPLWNWNCSQTRLQETIVLIVQHRPPFLQCLPHTMELKFDRYSIKKPCKWHNHLQGSLYLRWESNPNLKFRKLLFYPLNYGDAYHIGRAKIIKYFRFTSIGREKRRLDPQLRTLP